MCGPMGPKFFNKAREPKKLPTPDLEQYIEVKCDLFL